MLLTIGQMNESEQKEVVGTLNEYFKSITEFLYFEFKYLYNFTSGDILEIDYINKTCTDEQIQDIISIIKGKINM